MKIKLDKDGILSIDGIKKYCPFVGSEFSGECGIWCALFTAEIMPDEVQTIRQNEDGKVEICKSTVTPAVEVSLCRRIYECSLEDFTDEREKS